MAQTRCMQERPCLFNVAAGVTPACIGTQSRSWGLCLKSKARASVGMSMDNEGVGLGSMEPAEARHRGRMPGSVRGSATALLGDQGLAASHPHLRFPSSPPPPRRPGVRPPGRAGLRAGSWAPKGLQDSAPGVLQCILLQPVLHGAFRPSPHHRALEGIPDRIRSE